MRPEDAAQLNLERLDTANIGYSLRVRYDRKTDDTGQTFMNKLGTALRHADGVETSIRLTNGDKILNDQLRVSGPVKIETFDGVPDARAVFEIMRHWLLEKLDTGEIPD